MRQVSGRRTEVIRNVSSGYKTNNPVILFHGKTSSHQFSCAPNAEPTFIQQVDVRSVRHSNLELRVSEPVKLRSVRSVQQLH